MLKLDALHRTSSAAGKIFLLTFVGLFISCQSAKGFGYQGNPLFSFLTGPSVERKIETIAIFERYPHLKADSFEFPVGGKHGEGFYIAQKFAQENARFGNRLHLGEDWNFVGGGDSDFASPVYSMGDGVVSLTANYGGGWGKVIRIVYKLPPVDKNKNDYIEALYAHLYTIEVEPGQIIKKGEWIGSIGDADGKYPAHLHLELRSDPKAPLGGGYAYNLDGYLSPTKFIISKMLKEKTLTEEQFTYEKLIQP